MDSEHEVCGEAERNIGDRISRGETVASAYRLRPHSRNLRVSNLVEKGIGVVMSRVMLYPPDFAAKRSL
jgi:hypothetical protein